MRDPARIDQILTALREAWLQVPDERLGQFLDNCLSLESDSQYRGNMRNIEDDKWLRLIIARFSDK